MTEIIKGQRYRRTIAGSTSLWEVVSTGPQYTTVRKISKDGTIAATLLGGKAITMNLSPEGMLFMELVS